MARRLRPRADEGTDEPLCVLREAARALSKALKAVRALELFGSSVPDFGREIDFYEEVRRFEILLIEQALRRSGGNQARAAALLGLKKTTLNCKIKVYNINWRDAG
jgi:transcriptional regulator with GAF, ATPase, and Fis domain